MPLIVSQEAREAAADFIRSDECPLGAKFMLGGAPYTALCEAFARFEAETLERAAVVAEEQYRDHPQSSIPATGRRIATAIRNLKGTTG